MERTIVGLDLGTYTIKAAAANISSDGQMNLLGAHEIPSCGIAKGNIVDLSEASGAVETLMNKIREVYRTRIHKVILSVGGAGFSSDRSMGSIVLHGSPKELTRRDIESVIQTARNMSFSLDRFILHELIEGYILDGQEGVKDPLGLFTKKLEVRLLTLFHNIAYMQNVVRCINYAGFDVEKLVFSGLGSVNCMAREEEMKNGAAFIDIGADTTKVIIASDGRIRLCSLLTKGSADITRAISRNLRIPFSQAEKLKFDSSAMGDSESEASDIAKNKIEALFEAIEKELENFSSMESIGAGMVLSGGGALFDGLPERAEEFFRLPVRVGALKTTPANLGRPSHLYASCIGALEDYSRALKEKSAVLDSRHPITKITNRITTFLNEYF